MALDAVGLQQPLRYDVDIKSSLIRTPMTSQLMKGDRHANRVIVAIKDGKENVDLSGVTVTGSFIRPPDDAEIPLVGIVNGNEAIVVLEDVCYAQEGYCEISVMLTVGSTSRTILTLTGHVLSKGSGAVIDVGGVIPNINDIIAQYDEMKRVTQATQAAANAANEAASRAPYVGSNGNWYVWNASSGSYIDSGSKAQGPTGPQGPGAEIDDTLSQSGKAADAKKTGEALSQLSEQMADYRTAVNLFDNGDFLIAQAGYGGMHGNTPYAADRWSMTAGLTVSHDGVGLTITKPTSLVWYSGFKQVVDIKHLKGKHVTMVAYCKTSNKIRFYVWGHESDEEIHHSYAYGNNSDDGVYTVSFEIPSSLSDDYVAFSFTPDCDNTGAPVSKLRMALYPGVYDAETVPSYVPKGYAAELAECQRYYNEIKNLTLYGYVNSAGTAFYIGLMLPQIMRTKPTATIKNELKLYLRREGMPYNTNGMSINSVGYQNNNNIEIGIVIDGGLSANTEYIGWYEGTLILNADM